MSNEQRIMVEMSLTAIGAEINYIDSVRHQLTTDDCPIIHNYAVKLDKLYRALSSGKRH